MKDQWPYDMWAGIGYSGGAIYRANDQGIAPRKGVAGAGRVPGRKQEKPGKLGKRKWSYVGTNESKGNKMKAGKKQVRKIKENQVRKDIEGKVKEGRRKQEWSGSGETRWMKAVKQKNRK